MATKKSHATKNVTEIDDAKVKIEIEEVEEKKSQEKIEDSLKEEDKETEEDTAEEVKEEEEEVIENFDDENNGRFSWKKVILFTLFAAIIGAIIVGGYFAYEKGYRLVWVVVDQQEKDKSINIPEVTPEPTEAPLDNEKYEITVLNGSGIEGEAATVQELLEDEGFVVNEIGNADNATYLETEIRAGKDVDEEYLDELEKILDKRGPTNIEDAPDTQTEEVIVIVGSELADIDATPTPELE